MFINNNIDFGPFWHKLADKMIMHRQNLGVGQYITRSQDQPPFFDGILNGVLSNSRMPSILLISLLTFVLCYYELLTNIFYVIPYKLFPC